MTTLHPEAPAPKVSVCVVTYNQADYVGACLQSILEQKTDFPFEVIVSDDCSTDGTRDIIDGFAAKYPDRVRPIYHCANIGPYDNNLFVHEQARGAYVAHLDGDDLALPGKLQAQVDCLDAHPDASFAAHAVSVIGSDATIGSDPRLPRKGTIEDLLRLGTYFVHSSVMYRRSGDRVARPNPAPVDFYLHLERASRGFIYLDPRVFGAYRVHGGGISRDMRRREELESRYELAFDRALELGVPYERVHPARLTRRMSFAISKYLAGDRPGYQQAIRVSGADRPYASTKHLLLHWTRALPWLVGVYARWRGMT